MIRAGELIHKIELQELAPKTGIVSRDARGHKEEDWQTRLACWAKIEPISGTEQINLTEQMIIIATTKITTRFHRGVTPTESWSIKHDGRRLHIGSVINVEARNEAWEFMCGELKSV